MATYDATRFRATHNSYSGGARGSLVAQLDAGVRILELDVHATGFGALGDFRVGHLKPGSEVAFGDGNPETAALREWLGVVERWSDAHDHAPITIVLDSKDDLIAAGCGSPEDLNRTLESVFGPKLYTRSERDRDGSWPEVDELRNRVLCVLSGNGNTRASYRWAFGSEPALAANRGGDMVLVYRSTAGDLNCFVGSIRGAEPIEWQYKSTYAFSRMRLSQPVVGVNEEGWIVAAHRFEPPSGFEGARLESIVGLIGGERHVLWHDSAVFAIGESPRLWFQDDEIRELHAQTDGERQLRGTLDTRRGRVVWGRTRRTDTQPPPSDRTTWGQVVLRCATDASGAIVCGREDGELAPVRFRQVAFVEEQKGDERAAIPDALFFAADAKDKAAIQAARARGLVVRAWGFEQSDGTQGAPPAEQMAATDTPTADWYQSYTSGPTVAV